jgi:hypothetical protein
MPPTHLQNTFAVFGLQNVGAILSVNGCAASTSDKPTIWSRGMGLQQRAILESMPFKPTTSTASVDVFGEAGAFA